METKKQLSVQLAATKTHNGDRRVYGDDALLSWRGWWGRINALVFPLSQPEGAYTHSGHWKKERKKMKLSLLCVLSLDNPFPPLSQLPRNRGM